MKNIPCSRKKDILVIKQRDKSNYIINHEQESSPIAKMKNKNTVSPRIDGEIPNVSKYIPCEMDEIYEMPDTDAAVPFKKNGKWDCWYHQEK